MVEGARCTPEAATEAAHVQLVDHGAGRQRSALRVTPPRVVDDAARAVVGDQQVMAAGVQQGRTIIDLDPVVIADRRTELGHPTVAVGSRNGHGRLVRGPAGADEHCDVCSRRRVDLELAKFVHGAPACHPALTCTAMATQPNTPADVAHALSVHGYIPD